MPFGHMQVQCENDLLMTKHHFNKKNKKKLTVSEIFSSNVALSFRSEEYRNNNIELQENTPEEIKELVIEMDERISGSWKETQEDLLLQKKFWYIFENNMQKLQLSSTKYGLKTRAKFSANFLRNNQDWIK